MLRRATISLKTTCGKRQFSDRNVKVYKFLALPPKKFNENKELKLPPPTRIDLKKAETLEKISLVGIQNAKIIEILEESIQFADQILAVDTTNVKPLVTVLENESLYLREDEPKNDITRSELLSSAEETIENYFVTPLGNLEYIPDKKSFEIDNLKKACKN